MPKVFKKKRLVAVMIFVLLVLTGATAGAYVWRTHAHDGMPEAVSRQIEFVTFLPSKDSGILVAPSSYKFDSEKRLLSFVARYDNASELVISEQATTNDLAEDDQRFDKLIQAMQQYSVFESAEGKVYLTRPPELKGRQAAVMKAKGTLMFIQSKQDLNEVAWKKVFKGLNAIR